MDFFDFLKVLNGTDLDAIVAEAKVSRDKREFLKDKFAHVSNQ